jgi:hypothetical protein
VPCVEVAETVDVRDKKNLVRAHTVALKDDGRSVSACVEALVAPVVVDRSSLGRKKCDHDCWCGWMNASEGTNSSAKDGVSRHVCHSNEGRCGYILESQLRG